MANSRASVLDAYERANDAFWRNEVRDSSDDVLIEHLNAYANQNNINEGTQHRDLARVITINSILTQRHMERLDQRNTILQYIVIVLTIIATASSGVQIWYAYKADKKAEIEAPSNLMQQPNKAPLKASPSQEAR